jgi:hypothetical protein
MLKQLSRVVAGVALAATSFGLLSNTASAAPAGTVAVTPPTGTGTTSFTVLPPQPSFCPGDAVAGYRLNSFVSPVSNGDPGLLTYNNNGPIGTNAYPLVDPGGTPFVNATSLGIGDGLITGIPTFSFAAYAGAGLPAGNYYIGISCTIAVSGVLTTAKYWQSTVTLGVDGSTFAFVTPPNDVPEVPLNVLLPVSAAAILGAGFLVARKRQAHSQVST